MKLGRTHLLFSSLAVLASAQIGGAPTAQAADDLLPSEPPPGLMAKDMSLSFGVPVGGNPVAAGTAGIWTMLTPVMNVGLNVGLNLDTESDQGFDLLLAPAVRYYLAQIGPVATFGAGEMKVRVFDAGDETDLDLGAAVGLGAEWFITDVFSLAGWTGLGIELFRPQGGLRIGTLTTGLSVQIYWERT